MRIDLNSDLGEGFGPWSMGDDDQMLDIVTSANVACGFHAGDPDIMFSMAEKALAKGVAVGAHPGYRDLFGFGRRAMAGVTGPEIERLVAYQVGAFQSVCALAGNRMSYVKTHGALGNACNDDEGLADSVARGIAAADPRLVWLVMPGAPTERAAGRAGLRPAREVYADRTYADSFNLAPRSRPGTVIHDAALACERALRMVSEGRLVAESGRTLDVEIDSICVHGDNPASVEMARQIRAALENDGWTLAPFAP
ncbi:MAG: LamB/YcsF family protein [Albidovulum sp.]|nr:LamB/YcsF family protein [Albidovulum sp.]